MILLISLRAALVLLCASGAAAKALHPRACRLTTGALEGDTCEILSEAWGINPESFKSWNPDVDCSRELEVGRGYCIDWEGPGPVTTTSDKVSWGVTTLRPPSTTTTTSKRTTTTTLSTKQTTTTTTRRPTTVPTTTRTTTRTTIRPTTTSVRPGVPSPTQPGTTSDCTQYHKVLDSDTCEILVAKYRTFTLAQFYSWNPNVGRDCRDMWTDYYVCVAVKQPTVVAPPGLTQPGVNPRCNKWYYVKSGDTCEVVVARYGISLQTFYNWNPSVGSDCRNMWAQYYVCVGSA